MQSQDIQKIIADSEETKVTELLALCFNQEFIWVPSSNNPASAFTSTNNSAPPKATATGITFEINFNEEPQNNKFAAQFAKNENFKGFGTQ